MWIPHFGYMLWENGKCSIDSRRQSKIDNTERVFNVSFILENVDQRKIDSTVFELNENMIRTLNEVSPSGNVVNNLIMFEKNSDGRLSRIHLKINTTNFQSAVEKSYNSIAKLLSVVTFSTANPLSIYQIVVEDCTHNVAWEAFPQQVGSEKWALPGGIELNKLFCSAFALYREGRNSNSPIYRFFCFYKILEGFYKSRDLFKDADVIIKSLVTRNPELKRTKRKINSDLLLKALAKTKYPDLEGKTYGEFFKWITAQHRHLVAHIFPKDYTQEQWINVDDFDTYTEFAIVGNIVDLVVRDLLEDELRLWEKINMKLK